MDLLQSVAEYEQGEFSITECYKLHLTQYEVSTVLASMPERALLIHERLL